MIIVTSYTGPDLDGYSCAVGYAELLRAQGKEAEAHVWGEPQLEVQWLVKEFDLISAEGPLEDDSAEVVLLDASDLDGLPGALRPEQVIEIIDHRRITELEVFPNSKNQVELVGAAATLVAERFKEAGLEPSRESALLLYGGILSNTQNFSGIATDRDRHMADWVKEIAEAPNDLARQMFLAKSDLSGSKLRETLLGDSKVLHIQGVDVGTLQLEIIGVEDLINTRRKEIENVIGEVSATEDCDYVFANMKDLESGESSILCGDVVTKELLSSAPDVTWNGLLGKSKTFTLRKQITAWIDEKLSNA